MAAACTGGHGQVFFSSGTCCCRLGGGISSAVKNDLVSSPVRKMPVLIKCLYSYGIQLILEKASVAYGHIVLQWLSIWGYLTIPNGHHQNPGTVLPQMAIYGQLLKKRKVDT